MKQLKRISLIQFYLHEACDIEVDGSTAFLGPNGSGKSSTLDAIQIGMLGGNLQYSRFNSQSVSSKQRRSLASYCLGLLRNPDKDNDVEGRARDEARTYIILVFSDGTAEGVISAGLCIEAEIETQHHEIKGLFVLPGLDLTSADCIIYDGEDRRPIPYPEFRENIRERAKKIGRTPILTEKSSEYVSELLYALNGERMPDARRFMSAFVKSMTLKNVDSIDQFVRDYVVEPNPVDIAAFRTQVEQFVALRDLIKKTKARISRLTGIITDFDRARKSERRIASLEAIRAIFNTEYLCEQVDNLEDLIDQLGEQKKTAVNEAGKAKLKRDDKHKKVKDFSIQLGSDKDEQSRILLVERIRSGMGLIEAYQQPDIGRANRLINSLRDVLNHPEFSILKTSISGVIDLLVKARSDDNPGATVTQALKDIKNDLALIKAAANSQVSIINKNIETISDEKDASRRRISAAGQTGRLLNDGATLLLELLNNAGFEAQPISALASISDKSWSPALEAYLGNDRDALVVTSGENREAVKILRAARQSGKKINGAGIIQPFHLKNVDIKSKYNDFAVGILETENDTARRFLWNKFGNMRLVETEIELEKYPRSITRDGMLSQGGMTKSIRVAPISDLRLGKELTDTSELSRNIAMLQGDLDTLKKQLQPIESLANQLSIQGDNLEAESMVNKLLEAEESVKCAKEDLSNLDVSHLDSIRESLKKAEEDYKEYDTEFTKNDRIATGLGEQVNIRETEKRKLDEGLPSSREAESKATSNPLVIPEFLDELKDEIESALDEYPDRLKDVQNKLGNNEGRLNGAIEKGSLELSNYVRDEYLDVQLSEMDWHERFSWANDEQNKLTGTEIQNYESQAEEARQASEETLRSDIAMSLHDRFREMDLERRERNKILDSCPAFTGGEKYKFISTVVPHYEALVKYINQIAKDDQTLSLLSEDPDEINQTLRDLVEAAAESGNAGAVLDYRQFYNFDLEILVNGKRVDKMSNRQGAGSNGEHIAPMYVAAGAALAKAFRIHTRKGKTGAGLICLDEAFHGMDTTNAVATARFLQNIGLQLIMAGPELERTKLAPISQTIYDLDREGLDLLMERTKFKPAANSLMVSDMPGENPQVLEDAFRQLGLEVPPPPPLVEEPA